MTEMKTNYTKLTGVLIAAWFVTAVASSALHLLKGAPGQPPIRDTDRGLNSRRRVLYLVRRFKAVSRVGAVVESSDSDVDSCRENRRIGLSRDVHLQASAWDVRASGWVGRHRNRSNSISGRNETDSQSPAGVHRVAIARDTRPCGGAFHGSTLFVAPSPGNNHRSDD